MTHPLTPREKVDCVACEGRPAPENSPCAVCGRTALASGSSDHAELADRLMNMSLRWKDADQEREEASRAITALLAENAALRDYGKSAAKEALEYRDRATEAERELAEAYRTVRQFVAATNGTTYPSNHPMWAALESAQQLLSKEAERE